LVEDLTVRLKKIRLDGMTNNDRNMRTLIICFVLAIFALIPLRVVEIRQMNTGVQVLGAQSVGTQIQLPNAEVNY
jgi:hypothetical protein